MRETESKVWIYLLECPFTGAVYYVGKSRKPVKRVIQHIHCVDPHNDRLTEWIRRLGNIGATPRYKFVACVPASKGSDEENHWIAHYLGKGHPLTNKSYRGAKRKAIAGRADSRGGEWA